MPCGVSSGLKGSRRSMRHRVDGTGGGALAGGIGSRYRERISNDGLDDQAIGPRRQSVSDAKVHVKDADLEIGHREQCVLLVGEPGKTSDRTEVGVIFKTKIRIRRQLS